MKLCPGCKEEFYGMSREYYCSRRCKLMSGIKKETNGCWVYIKPTASGNYGRMRWAGGWGMVVKMAWQEFVGKIPAGKWVNHLCEEIKCINPDHLVLGDKSEKRIEKL